VRYGEPRPFRERATRAFVSETSTGDYIIAVRSLFLPPEKTTPRPKREVLLETFLNSFLLVFAGEMGDKTQLLALVLTARYRKPWVIFAGVFVATLLNHALASWAGGWIATLFAPLTLKWILALTFFVFAIWILIPDKEGELEENGRFGAFVTTVIAFFLAEMGDKTQLATIALGARYANTVLVTAGTTLGMMGSNALAIFLGERLLKRIPMQWIRIFACILFLVFGVGILLRF
jgi:putative Ca2+/H+ antiporter (TMEM165/GDT1 family)